MIEENSSDEAGLPPRIWKDVQRAKANVLKAYKELIRAIQDLGTLLIWREDYLMSRVLPAKKWDRMKTTHIREFFKSTERDMKLRIIEIEKELAAQEKKKALMEKYNLTEEDVAALIGSLR